MRLLTTYILLIAFSVVSIAGEETSHYDQLFEQANTAYQNGSYIDASNSYMEIVNADYQSATLYFNLANALYKQNQLPAAIVYYERAHKLAPNDQDIIFNLEAANQMITDKIEALPELFYKSWWRSFINTSSVDEWGMRSIVLLTVAALLFILYMLSNAVVMRKLCFWTAIISALFALFSYSAASQHKTLLTAQDTAIVFTPSVTIKSSPDQNSTNLFVIHEGTKVNVMENVNDRYKISIADGNVGWLKAGNVEVI